MVVSQRLLDDGRAGPGTIAAEMAKAIDAELAGESYLGVGSYRRVEALSLRWAQLEEHPADLFLVGPAQNGYGSTQGAVMSSSRCPSGSRK